ncbi:hypothetical protein B566_EDAN002407 [Ephemera danica]|nr:hypothetical protein B566_EDAN002407 [Ephemera danica]
MQTHQTVAMKVSLYFLVLATLFTALQCVDAEDPFCWAMGDPHYRTFDNKRFDFMGQNTYYLVKDLEFIVEVEHRVCGNPASGVTCTKSVTVRAEHFKINLLQKREVTINGRSVTVPWSDRGIEISATPENHVTGNRLKGLCGSYNGNTNDDFKLPDGSISDNANTFGNAWQTNDPNLSARFLPEAGQ